MPFSPEEKEALHAQSVIFNEAGHLMAERTPAFGLVWQQYGAMANLLNAARKVDRLMNIWWFGDNDPLALHKDALDDAYDALNYIGFFIQCAQEGNILGTAPTRPTSYDGLTVIEGGNNDKG